MDMKRKRPVRRIWADRGDKPELYDGGRGSAQLDVKPEQTDRSQMDISRNRSFKSSD
jgi:hypothetical protein